MKSFQVIFVLLFIDSLNGSVNAAPTIDADKVSTGEKYKVVVPLKLSGLDLESHKNAKQPVDMIPSEYFDDLLSRPKTETFDSPPEFSVVTPEMESLVKLPDAESSGNSIVRHERDVSPENKKDNEKTEKSNEIEPTEVEPEKVKEKKAKKGKKTNKSKDADEENTKYAYVKETRIDHVRVVRIVPVLKETIKKISLETGATVSKTVRTTRLGEGRVTEEEVDDTDKTQKKSESKDSKKSSQIQSSSIVGLPYPGSLASTSNQMVPGIDAQTMPFSASQQSLMSPGIFSGYDSHSQMFGGQPSMIGTGQMAPLPSQIINADSQTMLSGSQQGMMSPGGGYQMLG